MNIKAHRRHPAASTFASSAGGRRAVTDGAQQLSPDDLRIVPYADLRLLTGAPASVARWMVARAYAGDQRTLVAHINANNYYWLCRNPAIRASLLRTGVLLMDGIGMKIGGLLMGHHHMRDLNGTDLFPLVMARARQRGLRIYLLGGRNAVVHAAAAAIEARYPGVRVVGCRDGYFDPSKESDIVASIRQAAPDALLVGLGFPRQEEYTLRHHEALAVPLIWNVGGLFDFVSGAKPRAPFLIRRFKLEWLYRFMREPRLMWHRNLVAAPWFLWRALRARGAPHEMTSAHVLPRGRKAETHSMVKAVSNERSAHK